MTLYDDPNREAVGQPPIWAGTAGDEPTTPEPDEPEPEPEPDEPEPDDA